MCEVGRKSNRSTKVVHAMQPIKLGKYDIIFLLAHYRASNKILAVLYEHFTRGET